MLVHLLTAPEDPDLLADLAELVLLGIWLAEEDELVGGDWLDHLLGDDLVARHIVIGIVGLVGSGRQRVHDEEDDVVERLGLEAGLIEPALVVHQLEVSQRDLAGAGLVDLPDHVLDLELHLLDIALWASLHPWLHESIPDQGPEEVLGIEVLLH